jgi:hypothetical protein
LFQVTKSGEVVMGCDCAERRDWPTGVKAISGWVVEVEVRGRGEALEGVEGVEGFEETADADFELLDARDSVVKEALDTEAAGVSALFASDESASSSLSPSLPLGYSAHDSSMSKRTICGRPSSCAARYSKQ